MRGKSSSRLGRYAESLGAVPSGIEVRDFFSRHKAHFKHDYFVFLNSASVDMRNALSARFTFLSETFVIAPMH